jgi:16S rRNA (guanine527-N7)-methyltransferase
MDEFIGLFMKWNERINLSAASTREEVEEHIQDSRAVVPLVSGRVLDVGSGGGFPVVVAAIERPDVRFVALEPNHKKHAFLREVTRTLSLSNLETRCERLEAHPDTSYDVAMSRATFDLLAWLEIGAKHCRAGGRVLGFEGLPRTDLPATARRIAYSVVPKQRAIIELLVGE